MTVVAHALKAAWSQPDPRDSLKDAMAKTKDVPVVMGTGKYSYVEPDPDLRHHLPDGQGRQVRSRAPVNLGIESPPAGMPEGGAAVTPAGPTRSCRGRVWPFLPMRRGLWRGCAPQPPGSVRPCREHASP